MKNVTVQDVVLAAGGKLLSGAADTKLVNMSTDSRVIGEDCLFVPIVGANMDGHSFIEKACENGAKAVLTAREDCFAAHRTAHPEDTETAFILVEDTTDAVQKVGRMARTHLTIPAIGVTGSVGKTTTREMIACALSAEKKVYKTDKNYNNKLGVPITLCEMTDDDDIAVLELGLNVRGELGLISSLANIETAVITNIGVAHIEFYGTQDEICKEKFTVTKGFWPENPAEKVLILNADDPFLMKYKDEYPYRKILYGRTEAADYRAANIRVEGGKYVFDLCIGGKYRLTTRLSALGEHNVMNACAAFAAADHYGIDLDRAKEKLEGFTGFRNRLQLYDCSGISVIDDTYNASPASMKAGLDVLTGFQTDPAAHRYAILGDMFELGENAPVYHHEVGIYAAGKPIDAYFLVGENAIEIMRGINELAPFQQAYYCRTKEEACENLKAVLKKGDLVYIKASNGMKLHYITEELMKNE